MIFFRVEAEEADAKAQIDGEISAKLEIILKIRFNDLVALVVCALSAVLRVSRWRMRRAANLIAAKEKQIGKDIACGILAGGCQENRALHVACVCPNGLVNFRTLSKNRKSTELKGMFAKSESGIVSRTISWIRMAPRHVTRVNVQWLSTECKVRSRQNDGWNFIAESGSLAIERGRVKEITETPKRALCGTRDITGRRGECRVIGPIQAGNARPSDIGERDVVVAIGHGKIIDKLCPERTCEVRSKA